MGFTRADGQYADADEVFLADFTAQIEGTDYGEWIEAGDKGVARLLLDVTDHEGTLTLDVTIQTRHDADDASPRDVAAFSQVTDDGSARKCFAGLDRQIRVKSVVGGSASPTATFTVTGELV